MASGKDNRCWSPRPAFGPALVLGELFQPQSFGILAISVFWAAAGGFYDRWTGTAVFTGIARPYNFTLICYHEAWIGKKAFVDCVAPYERFIPQLRLLTLS
jgi:hypothetical protein